MIVGQKLMCIKKCFYIDIGHIYILNIIELSSHTNVSTKYGTIIYHYNINESWFSSDVNDPYYCKNYFMTMEEIAEMRNKKIDDILD